MSASEFADIVNELGPVLGVLAVVLGTVIASAFQARMARQEATESRDRERATLIETHRQNIELLSLQQKREEDVRLRQFTESDRADRLVVIEYVDLLLPRLIDVSSIYYISSNNLDEDERRRFLQLQHYSSQTELDPAHPEKTLGLRIAFLMFQLVAAMRIALNARWTRPLSESQTQFLAHWESDIEPVFCSGRYPGQELLYREQLEIVASEMLVKPSTTDVVRPLNWREWCELVESSPTMRDLADLVANKLQFIFDESGSLPPRRAFQCRLAIMALYLIQLSREAGIDSWTRREEGLWRVVTGWFKWESEQDQNPGWFVFEYGDVNMRAEALNE